MSQFIEANCRTFTAGAGLPQYTRVKLSGGVLVAAGAADRDLGTLERSVKEGHPVAVRLRTAIGTTIAISGVAIAVGDELYGAASGKVNKTNTGDPFGTAISATGAGDEYLEVLRH